MSSGRRTIKGVQSKAPSPPSDLGTGKGRSKPYAGKDRGPVQIFAADKALTPDKRLGELDKLVQAFQSLPAQSERPLRPGWGTLGKPGVVRANFFAVTMAPNAIWYEYEISISPDPGEGQRNKRSRIMHMVEKSPRFSPFVRHVAHDRHQRMISAQKLPQPLEIPVRLLREGSKDSARAPELTVKIKLLRKLSMSPLEKYMAGDPRRREFDKQPFITALNLVLQKHAARHGVRTGANRYSFPNSSRRHAVSVGLEAFRSFVMSVRPKYKQLMVNVNPFMNVFYASGNLAQAMLAFRSTGGPMPHSFAVGLKVSTHHLGFTRVHTISRVVAGKTARSEEFRWIEREETVTVEGYFKKKHNITLQYAHDLPLIDVSSDRDRPVYLPAELCEIIPGQLYRRQLDADQRAAMARVFRDSPTSNGESIVGQGFDDLGLRFDAPESTLPAFGVSVNPEMAVVPYRVLLPPTVSYRQGSPPVPIRGASWNLAKSQFHTEGDMSNWAVLLVQEGHQDEFRGPHDPEVQVFLKSFEKMCEKCGLKGAANRGKLVAAQIPPARTDDANRSQALRAIESALEETLIKKKPSFVLVLLSGVNHGLYHGIKKLTDTSMGIHTVCMLLTSARRQERQEQYFASVALKVNLKLGGVNHLLDDSSMKWLKEKRTMLMGVDVSHPSSSSISGAPSIAAVVASIDDKFVQFPASLALQKPEWNKNSKEPVEALTQMTMERLKLYEKRNNGKLPERILVYRDGVSDSQYDQILEEELPKLRAAFAQISPKTEYKPHLTIVVCEKRHHSLFWATDPASVSHNGNTLPGTVVDKGITDIYNFDFYLQAHDGLQGHVKPIHYTVLYDENKFEADTLQQGTHTASYLYARATNAVRLMPVASYADLACERGRSYLNVLLNTARERSFTQDDKAGRDRVYQNALDMWGTGVHEDLKESMFYI